MVGIFTTQQVVGFVFTVFLVLTVVIWAYQIYNNTDSGIILIMGGVVLGVSVLTVASYRLDLTVTVSGMNILPIIVGVAIASSIGSVLAGIKLFTKHTKDGVPKMVDEVIERRELEEKAAKVDNGNVLTRIVRGY